MRVFYDGNIYTLQRAGGINRYFANVIRKLPMDFSPTLLVEHIQDINYPSHPHLKIYKYMDEARFLENISYRLAQCLSKVQRYLKIEQYYYENITAFKHYNVAHPTYYSLLTRQEVKKYRCPVVITVWDLIHELFPQETDPDGQMAEEKRRAIAVADAIICISENTKSDLLERYSLPEDRVAAVTYLASEIDESLAYGPEPVPPQPYYLYVGSRVRYKNFDGLLSAFTRAASSRPDIRLCVVGQSFDELELKLIADLKLTEHVLNYGHVPDSHLAKLYRHSVAFVCSSLYEGFGIPLLEAMACGTVVVASDCSSIPEVVGDAGVLFDPRATDDLADILIHLLESTTERERLIAKGYVRARLFSWDKTAAQTIEVYRSVSA